MMETWKSWRSNALVQGLLSGVDDEDRINTLDTAVEIDDNLKALYDTGRLVEAGRIVEKWLETVPDEASAQASIPIVFRGPLPDGLSSREWIQRLHERIQEVLADPAVLPEPVQGEETGFEPPRVGRWSRNWAVDEVQALVLEPHEASVRAWLAEPASASWQRQHLYTDLSEATGVFGQVAPIVHPPYGSRLVDWDAATDASAAVVTLRRELVDGENTGRAETLFIRPELKLDTTVRSNFPDLCHFYGGYFGQEMTETTGLPSDAMANAMVFTRGEARNRLRTQLARLLEESESDIRYIVANCGSFALPARIRHWVERTLWRLDAYDWGDEPPLNPPPEWFYPKEHWARLR